MTYTSFFNSHLKLDIETEKLQTQVCADRTLLQLRQSLLSLERCLDASIGLENADNRRHHLEVFHKGFIKMVLNQLLTTKKPSAEYTLMMQTLNQEAERLGIEVDRDTQSLVNACVVEASVAIVSAIWIGCLISFWPLASIIVLSIVTAVCITPPVALTALHARDTYHQRTLNEKAHSALKQFIECVETTKTDKFLSQEIKAESSKSTMAT